jgi:hypothetical protein
MFCHCCTGGTLCHLQKFLQYTLNSPLSPLPPFLEQFQQVSFFHLHTCVHNISIIFTLLYLFLISYPLQTGTNPPDRTYFAFLFCFWKKKKQTFLFKICVQGVSLWHFHVICILYLDLLIPSIFLLFTLAPLFWFWLHIKCGKDWETTLHAITYLNVSAIHSWSFLWGRWEWHLNSGFQAWKAGNLLLQSHLQCICCGYFGDGVSRLFAYASLEPRSSWMQPPK